MSNRHYIIPIFVPHEGCPHNCVFCNQDRITGENEKVDANFTQKTIEEYLKTIDKSSATVEVSFFGGTFTAIDLNKQKELLSVAKHYKEQGKIDYIRLSTRPDYIDDNILKNLQEHSVDIIELGIQSMDEEVLVKSGRGHTEKDVIEASALIKKYNFILGHQIMLGLPGDTFQKDIETTKKIINIKPNLCRIYPSLVIKDTPMEIMYKRGEYIPYSLEEAVTITKEIYSMLVANNINIIRVGLQPTDNINEGKDIIAGPFHPAFRELVEGSLYNEMIINSIDKKCKYINIQIHPKDISKLYADKKIFFNDMKKQLMTKEVKVLLNSNINRGEVLLDTENHCYKLSINDYIRERL